MIKNDLLLGSLDDVLFHAAFGHQAIDVHLWTRKRKDLNLKMTNVSMQNTHTVSKTSGDIQFFFKFSFILLTVDQS